MFEAFLRESIPFSGLEENWKYLFIDTNWGWWSLFLQCNKGLWLIIVKEGAYLAVQIIVFDKMVFECRFMSNF